MTEYNVTVDQSINLTLHSQIQDALDYDVNYTVDAPINIFSSLIYNFQTETFATINPDFDDIKLSFDENAGNNNYFTNIFDYQHIIDEYATKNDFFITLLTYIDKTSSFGKLFVLYIVVRVWGNQHLLSVLFNESSVSNSIDGSIEDRLTQNHNTYVDFITSRPEWEFELISDPAAGLVNLMINYFKYTSLYNFDRLKDLNVDSNIRMSDLIRPNDKFAYLIRLVPDKNQHIVLTKDDKEIKPINIKVTLNMV